MIKLTPPNLSDDHIQSHITCVRPKRQGGARIESQYFTDKLVIHNYGHGGFGWSLLPGSVLHAIALLDQALQNNPSWAGSKNVTVLGAGCYGLLTAIFLHERGWNVTIIAEQTDELASHKAAGSLAVIAIKASKTNQPLMDQMAVDSYVFYKNAAARKDAMFAGSTPIPVYKIHDGTPNYRYPLVAAGVMPEPEDVVINFGNEKSYAAKKFDTFALDTARLMQDFKDKILRYEIPVITKKITAFAEVSAPVIFNCTGLGARAWDDVAIVPVQGHLVRVKNQPTDALGYMVYAHVRIDGKLREITWTPKDGGMLGASVVNWEERLDTNAELADAIIQYARIFFET